MATTGTIFAIQKFCSHDGPGIRTTVFCKGCPLSCSWCHNLEGRSARPEPLLTPAVCTGCGACLAVCPSRAASLTPSGPAVDADRCTLCGLCVAACPQDGREICGRTVTVPELLSELIKDRVFYEQSGGGVTFSGGEALAQVEFLREALTACKKAGLHTALDTCGHVPWASFAEVLPWTDLFLYDLKLMDPLRHQELTGVSNELILDNLVRLSAEGARITVRIPVIPSVNDDTENIRRVVEFLGAIRCADVHLLPYHPLGAGKAARLASGPAAVRYCTPSAAGLEKLAGIFAGAGLPVLIGGAA